MATADFYVGDHYVGGVRVFGEPADVSFLFGLGEADYRLLVDRVTVDRKNGLRRWRWRWDTSAGTDWVYRWEAGVVWVAHRGRGWVNAAELDGVVWEEQPVVEFRVMPRHVRYGNQVVQFSVPARTLTRVVEASDRCGMSRAEFHRWCVEIGLREALIAGYDRDRMTIGVTDGRTDRAG